MECWRIGFVKWVCLLMLLFVPGAHGPAAAGAVPVRSFWVWVAAAM
jgi:hypothetical protein